MSLEVQHKRAGEGARELRHHERSRAGYKRYIGRKCGDSSATAVLQAELPAAVEDERLQQRAAEAIAKALSRRAARLMRKTDALAR